MHERFTIALVAVAVAAGAFAPALALAMPPGPLATLKQKNGEVDRLLREKPAAGSPAEKKQKDGIKALAGTLLDYAELSKRAMAAHWDTLTPLQRDQFVATFRELIERHYVKQIRSNLDYVMQYKTEELAGDEATVNTLVKVKTKGKSTDAEIIYKVHKIGGEWRVWDVITDEVSLVRNYKSQFNKIITEKGYDELIKKMKSKIDSEGA